MSKFVLKAFAIWLFATPLIWGQEEEPFTSSLSGYVIPLVLDAKQFHIEMDDSSDGPWLTLEYRASPKGSLIHSEIAERVWWLQERPVLFLGSSGNPLPQEVLQRATAWLQIYFEGEPLSQPIPLLPRANKLQTEGHPESIRKTLQKRLGTGNAAHLSQVANYLAKNTSILEVEGNSFRTTTYGPVIDDIGQWLGITPWPWSRNVNYNAAYSNAKLTIGNVIIPQSTEVLLEKGVSFGIKNYPQFEGYIRSNELGDNNSYLNFGFLEKFPNGSTTNNYMLVSPTTGYMGIGTIPKSPLHVFSDLDVSLTNPGIFIIGDFEAGNLAFDKNEIIARNNGAPATLFLQDGGGPIEYRATMHTYKVGATHQVIMEQKTGNSPIIRPSTGGFGWLGDTDHAFWNVMTTNIYRDNEFTLSDRRIKKNIETLSQPMARLNQLRGVHYLIDTDKHPFYKNGSEAPIENQHRMGFIAQEFAQVFPGMVTTHEKTGLMAIRNQEELLPVLVEAIKEQQATIERQQEAMDAQSRQVASLMTRLQALENKLNR